MSRRSIPPDARPDAREAGNSTRSIDTSSAAEDRANLRRTFQLDILAATLYSTYGVAIVSFPAVLARKEGATDLTVSLVIAAPAIGQLSTILWAHYTQRFNKMKVLLYLGSLARLSLALAFFAFHPLILALVMVICFTLELAISPAYAGIMQEVYPDRQRGEYMGKVRVISSIVTTLGALALGSALEQFSFRYVYPFVALLGFSSVIAFTRIKYREKKPSRPPVKLSSILLLPRKDKRYGLFLQAVFLMGFFNLIAGAVYPLVIVDTLHASNGFVGLMNGVQSVAAIVSYFLWGKFIDRYHPALLTFISFVLWAGAMLIYTIAWVDLWLIPAAVLMGSANAAGDLANVNTAIRFAPERDDVPRYIALFSSLLGLRGLIAPFLAAFLMAFMSTRGVLVISLVGISLSCLNFYRIRKSLLPPD